MIRRLEEEKSGNKLTLSNEHLTAFLNPLNGYLTAIQYRDKELNRVNLTFVRYLARDPMVEKTNYISSGAYLFLPDGKSNNVFLEFFYLKVRREHSILRTIILS